MDEGGEVKKGHPIIRCRNGKTMDGKPCPGAEGDLWCIVGGRVCPHLEIGLSFAPVYMLRDND